MKPSNSAARSVGCMIQEPANLANGGMLLEIGFKESLDPLFRSKTIKRQGNNYFFIAQFIGSYESGASHGGTEKHYPLGCKRTPKISDAGQRYSKQKLESWQYSQ